MNDDTTKRCTKCGEEKPATTEYFRKDKTKKDGLYSSCKKCFGVRTREILPEGLYRCATCKIVFPLTNQYFHSNVANRTRLSCYCKACDIARVKARYIPRPHIKKSDEELKARKRKSDKEYAAKNKTKLQNYHREYYKTRSEYLIRKTKEWAENNPEKVRLSNKVKKARRRSLENQSEGFHTQNDIKKQYRSQKEKCWWCGCKLTNKFHADHLIPLARGGSNWPNNIVISCPKCNLSRRDKLPSEWIGRLF